MNFLPSLYIPRYKGKIGTAPLVEYLEATSSSAAMTPSVTEYVYNSPTAEEPAWTTAQSSYTGPAAR